MTTNGFTQDRETSTLRPLVYIAGPYTHPDPVLNTRAACLVADKVSSMGAAVVVPHLSLLWHAISPSPATERQERLENSGYAVPGAVWATPSGVKVDPFDPAFTTDTSPSGDADKPAIYLFSNSRDGDGIAYAMAEDGTVLGSHLCSHWGYMRHDLHDRTDRKARCEEHYPDGYRLVILGASELPPTDVLERNRQQGEAARAAGSASQAEEEDVD